jgi:glycosyltransferase involved in cell wall biosynthesis
MRILKTVQAYFPFQEKGGPVVKVRSLARGLLARGHQITVLTADLGLGNHNEFKMRAERCPWGWRSEQVGIEVIYLSTIGHYRALTSNPHVIRFCRRSLSHFNLVHIYGLYDLLGPAVSYFCRRQGIPYVIEPMGMYRPIVRSLRMKQMYFGLLGKRLVEGAQFLIATSEQEKKELVEGGIEESRIVIRRNGVDSPESLPAYGEFRQRRGIAQNAKLVLYLGRMVSKKSPDLLLEAFAGWRSKSSEGRDAVLVLAGPDEGDAFLSRLKRMADQFGLTDSVRFAGPLYDEAKWQAYRDADVFVLPSQNENFGNTAAESAACGTPVIVTDRCGIAPFVGQAGLVVSHDRGDLERALTQLLADPSLRQRFKEGCSKMARALSWEGPLDQSESLYQQCLTGRAKQ